MLDTIRIRSPFLTPSVVFQIEKNLVYRSALDRSTSEILYEFTAGELKGTFDSRIGLYIKKGYYDKVKEGHNNTAPYLEVECSVHKILLGHNCYGLSNTIIDKVSYLLSIIEKEFNVKLPNWYLWQILRVDFAKVFKFTSEKALNDYFSILSNAQFPRRKVARYGYTGIYCSGSTTTVKLYDKGEEFKKHDFKKLRSMKIDECHSILETAKTLLRVEVEIKSRKFKSDFGRLLYVSELNYDYLENLYNREVMKLLKENIKIGKIVRNSMDIEKRLRDMYSDKLASVLIGFWCKLATYGEEKVKKDTKKSTFYLNRKYLQDAGVSWHSTDIVVKTKSEFSDFVPTTDSNYLYSVVDDKCNEVLFDFNYMIRNAV